MGNPIEVGGRMKRLILILLPVIAFAQSPDRTDTTVTLYYAAWTSYIPLATAVSRGLYDDANANRNPTRYPSYVTDIYEDARLPIEKINWDGFTHAVLFLDNYNVDTTGCYADPYAASPYYLFQVPGNSIKDDYENYGGIPYMQNFIDSAHAHNVKVLTIIQAVSPFALNYVTDDSARIDIFADTVGAYVRDNGFDGVSLNWEGWMGAIQSDTNKIAYLLYRIREELDEMDPPGFFEMAPGGADYNYRYPRQAVNDCIDANHMQLYIYTPGWDTRVGRGTIWWECPVYTDSFDPANFNAISGSWGPTSWISRGYDVQNLGMLLPALGRIFKGVDSIYGSYWLGSYLAIGDSTMGIDVTYQDVARLKANGGTDTNSTTTFGYAVKGTATTTQDGVFSGRNIHSGMKFFATFMDSTNIAEAVEYGLDSLGITHFAMFSLTNDPAQIAHGYFADQFNISGESPSDPYAISSGTMSEGTVGVAYADTLVGTSPVTADYRILIRGLPPGLWLKWDGVIQGTPTTAGTYTPSVRIQARNTRAKQAWEQISITINAE